MQPEVMEHTMQAAFVGLCPGHERKQPQGDRGVRLDLLLYPPVDVASEANFDVAAISCLWEVDAAARMIADRLFDKNVPGYTVRRLCMSTVGAAMTERGGTVKVIASAEGAPKHELVAATDHVDGRKPEVSSHPAVLV